MTAGVDDSYESREEAFKTPAKAFRYWMDSVDAADEEEKKWRDTSVKTWKIYDGSTKASFNVLHSNVETRAPAVYNSVPVADCRTRYNDKNEVAREAAQVIERALMYEADEYDIDEQIKRTVKDTEITGRGVAWIEFDPTIGKQPRVDPTTGQPVLDDKTGQPAYDESVIWASVKCAYLPWQRFRRGPGSTWPEVPWVSREKFLTRDELIELAGEKIGREIQLDATQNGNTTIKDKSKRENTVWKCACVKEIWDKASRKVWYIAPGYTKGPIAVLDDPLKLKDFLPLPRPMQTLFKDGSMVPLVPYSFYSAQAEELNVVSARILKLIEIAKYRGVRASELKDIEGLDALEDGQFAPSVEAMALLQNGGALQNAFWIMPLGELVNLIKELGAQREVIRITIDQLSGVADIMRGSTDPNETLGAQQMKAQWGSLRIQDSQKEVQRFCRDLYRLKAEIISEHFPDAVLSMIAGQELDPEVIKLLRSDIHRRFMVDIETDSTIAADKARDQGQMTAFLDASGRFMQLATGSIAAGIPPELPLVIYQSFASKFKLGKQVDDVIAKLSEAAKPIMEQKQAADAEAKQKADEANEIAKGQALADVDKTKAETAKTMADAQATAMPEPVAPMEPAAPMIDPKVAADEAKSAETKRQFDERLKFDREQKDADRKHQMSLKHIDRGGVEETGEDGQPVVKSVNDIVKSGLTELGDKLGQLIVQQGEAQGQQGTALASQLAALAEMLAKGEAQAARAAAPKRRTPVRDPQTNRIIHVDEQPIDGPIQ